jgi:hypothetical protein
MNYFIVVLISVLSSSFTVWLMQGQLRKAYVGAKDSIADLEHKIKHLLLIPHDHKVNEKEHSFSSDYSGEAEAMKLLAIRSLLDECKAREAELFIIEKDGSIKKIK